MLALDMKKVFRSGTVSKTPERNRISHSAESENVKARYILGLDSTFMTAPGRSSSVLSTASSKPRGVTFSDATTAAVSVRSTTEDSSETYGTKLKRKGSSILIKRNRKLDVQEHSLRPQISDTSLRSFYDKSRAPLNVSQQTSDSSSRDFALRRGVPSVMSTSSQEKEHGKQLRLFTKVSKIPNDKRKHLIDDRAPSRTSSSAFETNPATGSRVSQISTSRITVTRTPVPAGTKSPVPAKHAQEKENPYSMVKLSVDPTQAKINIRRPKVGTRNWFDDVDSDSSEGEGEFTEPRLETEFAADVKDAFESGRIVQFPPRSSSVTPNPDRAGHAEERDIQSKPQQDVQELLRLAAEYNVSSKVRRKRVNPFESANLQQQSLLWLSSSEDSDNEVEQRKSQIPSTNLRVSLINGPWDESDVVVGTAVAVDTKSPDVVLQDIRKKNGQPKVPRRIISKLGTYLDDESSSTLNQQDLMTSFPDTPTDSISRAPSLRESMLSDSESMASTKLMTVTRQEESLIAAMRLKKVAMRKARSNTDRKDALRVLEQDADSARTVGNPMNPVLQKLQQSRSKTPAAMPPIPIRSPARRDSITTIQTDSMPGHSIRSSIATYLSEGSEDLQLPYSSIYGLPMGSSVIRPSSNKDRRRDARDTFLSEMTFDSTITASPSEKSANGRDSHVVLLCPIERQLLREEIPSQLFLESPCQGWNIQTAH